MLRSIDTRIIFPITKSVPPIFYSKSFFTHKEKQRNMQIIYGTLNLNDTDLYFHIIPKILI